MAIGGGLVHQLIPIDGVGHFAVAVHPIHHPGPGILHRGEIVLQRGIGLGIGQAGVVGITQADILGIPAAVNQRHTNALGCRSGEETLELLVH